MTLHPNTVGVDIARDRLDVYCSHTGRAIQIANDNATIAAHLALFRGAFVVFEATSGCDATLRRLLTTEGIAFARVNPRRAREFARAAGVLAKTDRVDARMLALMGQRLDLDASEECAPERAELAELVARREQIVQEIVREKNRLSQARTRFVRADIAALLRVLEKRREKLDAAIRDHIAAHDELADIDARLREVPGIGTTIAATLIAELPELGHRDRRAIAALAGLAPLANDSGRRAGKRRIWGGRRKVRRALFIAALHAARHDPIWRQVRERFVVAGKAAKTALVAIARRLLVVLNAMLRDGSRYAMQT